jgi:aryl-alcohol dehydrogenase-like predicted oxidoreductase
MLDAQRKAGKIRHIGISISSSIPEAEMEYQAARAREVGAQCLQVVYNLLERRPEDQILPLCRKESLGFLARVPLASGFLAGSYRSDQTFATADHRSKRSAEDIRRTVAEVERIRKEEVPSGVNMAAWALAWCLRTPGVTAVIPGSSRPEQVAMNASAVELLPA